jgi:beta-lactamase class D
MKIRTLLTLFALFSMLTLNAQKITTPENWGEVFDKYKCNGTIVLYKTSSKETKTFNAERADSGYLPASTFKIINSLIALETKAVQDINDTIKWDGVDRGWHKWNRDQTIKTGFPISCVWFYQELARRIGEKNMQQWIDTVGYGNSNICCQIDNFWLEGELRISANEQVKFIERIINNKLPFNSSIQERVKKVMISDSTAKYVMHSKTGGGLRVPEQVGWFVGYIETDKGIWITVLNIDLNTKEDSKYRKQIVYDILKIEGIID